MKHLSTTMWCCLYSKDTISKAIHNISPRLTKASVGVAYTAKIQFRKQFTTLPCEVHKYTLVLLIQQRYNFESNSQQSVIKRKFTFRCCLYSKDTISKAIHNLLLINLVLRQGVAYTAKIQFRKQFTTSSFFPASFSWCCLYSKDTISKAIHNRYFHL